MKKPRKDSAQSVVEFIVIFVIVAVASVLLVNSMPGVFNIYITKCTQAITGENS